MKNLIQLISSNCRLCLLKIGKGKRFIYHAHSYYLGQIEIQKHSKVILGNRACISENAYVGAIRGGYISAGIGFYCGRNCVICSMDKIKFGDWVSIGPNMVIYDHDHDYRNDFTSYKCDPVIIGNHVWIGAGAIILRGTVIGDNCVVAAGSIVKGKYSPNSLIMTKLTSESRPILDTAPSAK
jgi:acetyltransferase-like isoleucine patch superfamily enzyme